MGIFTSFFASQAPAQPFTTKALVYLSGAARFEIENTGEEQYQDALEAICGPRVRTGINRYETALLKLEDENPHDQNAVRVEILGKQIGYLGPKAAILYRQQLIAKGMPKGIGQCSAVIRGGWLGSDGSKGPYCVWLDLPFSY